ncbi:RNA polymerase recycling motor HelD [Clostridium neuense]|uniref:RNA polymerase recycling motor HelD n=1 Tax=Clostridium neuense TaxID=1728934 RepID=A0ABW8TII2_9CLOT
MAIEKKEFQLEDKRLYEAEKWIDNQIKIAKQNDKELEDKIADLKKQSKGRYNEELEISEKLYNITHKNLEKYLEAKPTPYFARIDFREKRSINIESYYIGKFGLGDNTNGEEKVIDWRAPIADVYYSGTQGEVTYKIPNGYVDGELYLKRKFIIKDSKLKDAFDEGINEIILRSAENGENALADEFLRINLEENISGKLKDIVATIQKEQNDIIRSDRNSALVVQGSAGSGKTTIALHRLAYLLYKHSKSISGKDVLVVAPNKLFLDYISDVLPGLGANKVKQVTFEDMALKLLNLKGKVYTKDKKLADVLEENDEIKRKCITAASTLKGSPLFKEIIDEYLKYIEKKDSEIEDIKVENYVLFDKKEVKRLFVGDMAHLPIDKRKDEIKKYFELKINDKIINICEKISFNYEYNIARIKKTMEDGIERRKKLIQLYDERDFRKKNITHLSRKRMDEYFENWKHTNTEKLLGEFFNSKEVMKEIVGNKVPSKLLKYMVDEFNSNTKNDTIDADDLAVMLYIKFSIEQISEKSIYKHIVIDEAQDYSIFQFSALRKLSLNDSFTIVGDLGQGIYFYKGIDNWKDLNSYIFNENFKYVALTQSYRSTVEIINFANEVLKKQSNGLKPAKPVLRHGKAPEVIEFKCNKEFCEKVDAIVVDVEKAGKKTIAVVGKNHAECKRIKDYLRRYGKYDWKLIRDNEKNYDLTRVVIPSYMTKGLEFDCTIVYNCSDDDYSNNELDKKILYVVLTRALHFEYIFYNGKKSKLIDNYY